MKSSPSRRLFVTFLFAALLLLKAAMPWLASSAAQARGVDLAEICTFYGTVKIAPVGVLGEQPDPPQSNHAGTDHCALASLGASVPPRVPPAVTVPSLGALTPLVLASRGPRPHDPSARWIEGRKHAPPFWS